MTRAKIAITLPEDLLAAAQAAVAAGEAASVSGYIATAITSYRERQGLRAYLQALIDEHGAPTPAEREWARQQLSQRSTTSNA